MASTFPTSSRLRTCWVWLLVGGDAYLVAGGSVDAIAARNSTFGLDGTVVTDGRTDRRGILSDCVGSIWASLILVCFGV
jgi:hypothetical protein